MKKIILSGILIFTLVLSGCKNFLDINDDPNNAKEVSITSILPVGQVYSAHALGYTTQLLGSFWVQHYTQNTSANQYNSLVSYDLDYNNTFLTSQWMVAYRSTIPSLRDLKAQAEKLGDGYKEAYTAVSEIMEAFNWFLLNSFYDRICYKEGQLGENNLNPNFESSQESYQVVITLLEDILGKYTVAALQTSANATFAGLGKDMIFDGDMSAWMKFANTIYLKALMRDFTANQTKIQTLVGGTLGFLDGTTGDARFEDFEDLPNKSNPLYEGDRRQLNSTANIKACSSTVDYLVANGDPRVDAFYEPDANDNYVGGQFSTGAGAATSRARLAPLDPVYFASVAEAYFLKAEVYARLGDAANAKTNYDAGVTAAFDRWEMDASSFIAAGGPYEFVSAAAEAMVEQIITQKWLASIRCQAWDSWMDQTRTGYPVRGTSAGQLEPHSGSLDAGTYPQRFLYPKNSSDYNTNSPAAVKMNEKLWWQK